MSALPKLKVVRVPVGYPKEEIMDLEAARYRLNYDDMSAILVEGRPVRSHEELVELVNQENFQNREFIEVTLVVEFYSGG